MFVSAFSFLGTLQEEEEEEEEEEESNSVWTWRRTVCKGLEGKIMCGGKREVRKK